MDCYEHDFEEPMLKDTADYYRRKAAVWVQVCAGIVFACALLVARMHEASVCACVQRAAVRGTRTAAAAEPLVMRMCCYTTG